MTGITVSHAAPAALQFQSTSASIFVDGCVFSANAMAVLGAAASLQIQNSQFLLNLIYGSFISMCVSVNPSLAVAVCSCELHSCNDERQSADSELDISVQRYYQNEQHHSLARKTNVSRFDDASRVSGDSNGSAVLIATRSLHSAIEVAYSRANEENNVCLWLCRYRIAASVATTSASGSSTSSHHCKPRSTTHQ